jgi:hypothetical protein
LGETDEVAGNGQTLALGRTDHYLRVSSDGGRTFGPDLYLVGLSDQGDRAMLDAVAPGVVNLIWSEPAYLNAQGALVEDALFARATVSVP